MKKLRKMTQQEVDEMCKKHEAWLENRADGARADFSGASLKGLSLKNADLRFANLEGADLRLVRATAMTISRFPSLPIIFAVLSLVDTQTAPR